MRTRKMRLVSALLALAMMFLLMPVAAFATNDADTLVVGKLKYEVLDDGTVSVQGPTEVETDRVIPSTVTNPSNGKTYTVTKIADYAFCPFTNASVNPKYQNASNVGVNGFRSITIANTITEIGLGAFYGCGVWGDNDKGLQTVEFEKESQLKNIGDASFAGCYGMKKFEVPSEVERIGDAAFYDNCSITEFVFQENDKLTYIGSSAFHWVANVKSIKLPKTVETIGEEAFIQCGNLETIELPSSVKTIGKGAFNQCQKLETVIYDGTQEQWINLINSKDGNAFDATNNQKFQNPQTLKYLCDVNFNMNGHGDAIEKKQVYVNENVAEPAAPTADGYAFEGWYKDEALTEKFDFANEPVAADMTLYAKWEKIPADLTVSTEKLTCTVGETAAMEFAVVTNGDAGSAATASLTVSDLDAVDSLKVNGQTMKDKGFTYSFSHLIGMTGKAEAVFNKAGTYTLTATLAVQGSEPVVRKVEVTVKEKPVEPVVTYDLTVRDGKVKVDGNSVTANEKGVYEVAEGAEVEIAFDKSTLSDAQVFDQWTINPANVLNAVDPKAETIAFKMPAEKVTIEAMTRDATIESDGPGVLGTAAMIGVGVAGTAVLGYQGYMIGTELYLKYALPAWAAIPQTRGQLALLLWQDADRPEPAEKTPYADMNEADAEEQQAARWVVEMQLMEAAKDSDDSFAPDAPVSRWEIIQSWNRAQKLKNN